MKKVLYFLHSKWSLLAAIFPRLLFYESTLRDTFPGLWQYRLELPHKDGITFFPYIVSLTNGRAVKDPINIAAYGVNPSEFISLLRQANPLWHQFLGSSYFLYTSPNYGWRASVALKLDINERARERHHIRLFGLKTRRGEKITLAAGHHDCANHTERGAPVSWDETRDIVAKDIAATCALGTLCGQSERVTDLNWRGVEGDGKILIIKVK